MVDTGRPRLLVTSNFTLDKIQDGGNTKINRHNSATTRIVILRSSLSRIKNTTYDNYKDMGLHL